MANTILTAINMFRDLKSKMPLLDNVLTTLGKNPPINYSKLFGEATFLSPLHSFELKKDFDDFLNQIGQEYRLVFRGSKENDEIHSILKHQKLGAHDKNFASDSLNIFDHVIKNESQNWYYSGTDNIGYSRFYIHRSRIIPTDGHIIIFGYPRVMTRPSDIQKLIPEFYQRYCLSILDKNPDEPINRGDLKFLGNDLNIPELTTILRVDNSVDFSPNAKHDVHSILHIYKPGKVVNCLPDSPYVEVQHVFNTDFKVRQVCFEMLLMDFTMNPEQEEAVSENARNLGLIPQAESLLSFNQVKIMIQSAEYQMNEYKEIGDQSEPVILTSLPTGIKDNELVDYLQSVTKPVSPMMKYRF